MAAAPPVGADDQIPRLGLPLDLRGIGVNYTLTPGGAPADGRVGGESITAALGTLGTASAADGGEKLLRPSAFFAGGGAEWNTNFFLDGAEYNITQRFGSGAYGKVFRVSAPAARPAGMPAVIAMKVIAESPDGGLRDALAEGIIQHIIFESTKGTNHIDRPYTFEVYRIFRMRIMAGAGVPTPGIAIFMKFAPDGSVVLEDKIRALKGLADNNGQTALIVKISRILQNLQRMYNYIHGDLHGRNINVAADGTVKIIDFGRSKIEIDGLTIRNSSIASINFREFDNLYLLTFLALFGGIATINTGLPIVQTILGGPTLPIIGRVCAGRGLACNPHHHVGGWMGISPANRNPAAVPLAVLAAYNAGNAIINADRARIAAYVAARAAAAVPAAVAPGRGAGAAAAGLAGVRADAVPPASVGAPLVIPDVRGRPARVHAGPAAAAVGHAPGAGAPPAVAAGPIAAVGHAPGAGAAAAAGHAGLRRRIGALPAVAAGPIAVAGHAPGAGAAAHAGLPHRVGAVHGVGPANGIFRGAVGMQGGPPRRADACGALVAGGIFGVVTYGVVGLVAAPLAVPAAIFVFGGGTVAAYFQVLAPDNRRGGKRTLKKSRKHKKLNRHTVKRKRSSSNRK